MAAWLSDDAAASAPLGGSAMRIMFMQPAPGCTQRLRMDA
jgi:hypothetical protein